MGELKKSIYVSLLESLQRALGRFTRPTLYTEISKVRLIITYSYLGRRKADEDFRLAGNVMIHSKGAVEIIDFGVAGQLESAVDKRATFIGTPHWMSPEILEDADIKYGKEVSHTALFSRDTHQRSARLTC